MQQINELTCSIHNIVLSEVSTLTRAASQSVQNTQTLQHFLSTLYVASGTRSDIMFVVSKLSHFLNCYHEVHWQVAIWVVHYLKGTQEMTLELGGSSLTPTLIGYCNSDYANDLSAEERESVVGYCFSLGSGVISWSSKRQKTIADSTCTAEYCIWMTQKLAKNWFGFGPCFVN